MFAHILSILSFLVVSFAVQGGSHFAINKAHFDKIEFMRKEPILPMGLGVMLFQGALMSLALSTWRPEHVSVIDGLMTAGSFGLFLLSYIALVEPSKYSVPSVKKWISVESSAGIVQFALYGLVLGSIHAFLR